ncbi:hypothetical protein UNSWDHB_2837 [Dehalobacter sp. UNSWDHB]|uniref:hypothetical protein n=1 Tax=unclassified Dehalobacter TaxID=2635733 RepID=UPI00028B42E8|nr:MULTISPECIES: hypothetical protein [unclassified Dehalobacter]AFV01748.1 hypothetical protein DHBDCA_p719 [Dehalobacter sp. DCA]AFV04786.1 hypothetical protein DCF50_p779 [Dehalobacter sp. CF]EQB19822.1 hypothetical protein UNSWDHB_2837 [Dehalobacter sp. UNSWDHB]
MQKTRLVRTNLMVGRILSGAPKGPVSRWGRLINWTYTLAKALSRRKINQISMGEALQSARD